MRIHCVSFSALVCLVCLGSGILTQSSRGAEALPGFQSAKPIWPEAREKEKNLTVGFRAEFDVPAGQPVLLRLTGSSLCRSFLNGAFLSHGPARGPHGFYRVDEIDLTRRVRPGRNLLAIEVVGYNVNSFYLLDQPSFLQAEVVAGGKVLASTAGEGVNFTATAMRERLQKVQRYSFQRPFTEVYRLTPGYDQWRLDAGVAMELARCAIQPVKALLPRRVPLCEYPTRPPTQVLFQGVVETGRKVDKPWKDRSLTQIGPKLGGFLEKELETIPSLELQTIANITSAIVERPYNSARALVIPAGGFQILDFGVNYSGTLGARLTCKTPVRVFFTFDEVLRNGDVDFKRLGCVNAVVFELQPGTYDVETFEPYTLRYLKLMALGGGITAERLYLREFASPLPAEVRFVAGDARLNKLFAAGVETFRQNATDVFMDCPSRERAGWLCDSYFTSRVAADLNGHTLIERAFLENFLLPPKFEHLPEGMLPMCYPSDHYDGVFIPNWAMWFVVELEEYLARSGDREMVSALEPRLMKLLDYFRRFRNSDGLLEKLESWVFVEWSKANSFVQDVNYPSNMLFAEMLAAMGRMYGRADLLAEAEKIRDVIRRQSFDGEFFVDNAIRKDGQIQVTKNRTEVCQYFAFYFHIATPDMHPKLWQTLVRDFGPQREKTKAHPQVHPANAFIGNVLRLELLSRAGLCQQLLDESIAYQLYMADKTGTLWENVGDYASCNHGFASHGGVHVLYRDVLGLARVDAANRGVEIRFTALQLDRCEGSLPVPGGKVSFQWRKDGGKLYYALTTPRGYSVKVENRSGLELIREH